MRVYFVINFFVWGLIFCGCKPKGSVRLPSADSVKTENAPLKSSDTNAKLTSESSEDPNTQPHRQASEACAVDEYSLGDNLCVDVTFYEDCQASGGTIFFDKTCRIPRLSAEICKEKYSGALDPKSSMCVFALQKKS